MVLCSNVKTKKHLLLEVRYMEYSLQHLSKTKVEISLSVGKEEWEEQVKASFNKNKFKYSLPGFRKGKVPFNVLVKNYGIEYFYEDAIDDCLNKQYGEILDKEKLEVIDRPQVDIKEVSQEGLKATITVVIAPEVVLGQYKGLTFKRDDTAATDEEIDNAMKREQEKRARLITKDGAAEEGDTVVLDYSGSTDGKKFEGGTAENQTLELGSHSFIPGFEEQVVGMKAGESKDINVTFPKEYHADLAGKDAVFAITVHEVQKKELPVIDDEFVKDIEDEISTVAEWKEKIAKEIADRKTQNADAKLENDILDAVIKNTEMEIPDVMVEEEIDYRLHELENRIKGYGMKFEDYLKYTGTTVEKIRADEKEAALHNVQGRLVIEQICKDEKITVTAEDIKAKLSEQGMDETKAKADYINYLANTMMVEKLFNFLKENNTIE